MITFSPETESALLENSRKSQEDPNFDPTPVVKLFTPWARGTWLITEMNPSDHDLLYGLGDFGNGAPELGDISLSGLNSLTGPGGLTVEIDKFWTAKYPISEYARRANDAGKIVF